MEKKELSQGTQTTTCCVWAVLHMFMCIHVRISYTNVYVSSNPQGEGVRGRMCTSISYCTALQIWSLAVGGTSELVRIVPN